MVCIVIGSMSHTAMIHVHSVVGSNFDKFQVIV